MVARFLAPVVLLALAFFFDSEHSSPNLTFFSWRSMCLDVEVCRCSWQFVSLA